MQRGSAVLCGRAKVCVVENAGWMVCVAPGVAGEVSGSKPHGTLVQVQGTRRVFSSKTGIISRVT